MATVICHNGSGNFQHRLMWKKKQADNKKPAAQAGFL
jgi:hypothetical protein